MWKCSMCGNENKDAYRFCLNCGNPRPERDPSASENTAEADHMSNAEPVKAEESKAGKKSYLVLVLLLLALVAAVFVLVLYPRIKDWQQSKALEETVEISGTEGPAVILDTLPSSEPTPPPIPVPTPTPLPTAEPEATPEPTPAFNAADGYLLPESDSRYLTRTDLQDLTQEQCCLARNEIYARHGRQFNTAAIASYFSTKSWYQGTIPAANFSETVLNDFEKANIAFIYNYELERWGGTFY